MSRGGGPPISSSTPGWKAYIPAFTRSETGWLGFSVEPDDRAGRVEFHDAPGGRPFGMEDGQRRDRAVFPVRLDQGSQIEIGEVVGVAGQEHLFPVHPGPVGGERAGAAEQFRLEEGAHALASRLAPRGGDAPRPAGDAG